MSAWSATCQIAWKQAICVWLLHPYPSPPDVAQHPPPGAREVDPRTANRALLPQFHNTRHKIQADR